MNILPSSFYQQYSILNLKGSKADAHSVIEGEDFAAKFYDEMPSGRVLSTGRSFIHAWVNSTQDGKFCTASHETIAEKCGSTRETVCRYMMDFVKAGFIHSENRFPFSEAFGGNRQTSNKMRFTFYLDKISKALYAARQRAAEVLRARFQPLSKIAAETKDKLSNAVKSASDRCDLTSHTLLYISGLPQNIDKSTGEILPPHTTPPHTRTQIADFI